MVNVNTIAATGCPTCHAAPGAPCATPDGTGRRTPLHFGAIHPTRAAQPADLPTFLTLRDIAARAYIAYGSARVYHVQATKRRAAGLEKPTDLPAPTIHLGNIPGWAEPVIDAWIKTRDELLR